MARKIVIATGIYPPAPGGPATHAKRYAEALRGQGDEISVLTYDGEGEGVHTIGLSSARGLRYPHYLYALWRLSRGASCIVALDALGIGFPVWIVSRLRRVPYVLRVGGDALWERSGQTCSMNAFYEHEFHSSSLLSYVIRLVLRGASHVFVPTVLLAAIYERYYNMPEGKIEVLPNPLPERTAVCPPVRDDVRTIVYASRFVEYKNLVRLIDAFARVHEAYPDTQLYLFGDGPSKDTLLARVAAHSLESAVFIQHALHEEVLYPLESAYLTVAPAFTEFYPNYVMEGLRCGVPCVISKEHGLPFALDTNVMFDAYNTDDVARALVYGLTHRDDIVPLLEGIPTWEQYIQHITRSISKATL